VPVGGARIPAVRRFFGLLVVILLAVPASVGLPSQRVSAGESCKMSCDHGQWTDCCCASGKASSFRRCMPDGGGFVPLSAARVILPPVSSTSAPVLSGWVALLLTFGLLPGSPGRPEPVPRLLS
jgi:hypothetical protein